MNDKFEKPLLFLQWERVHFLGKINLDLEHPRLYRYEHFSRFKENYQRDKIVFPSPLSWPDLFEQRFLSDGFLKRCLDEQNSSFRDKIFALCCTGEGYENADAQWNVRKLEKDDFCIRYSFDLWKFLKCLEKSNGKGEFYVSAISYDYSQDELMQNMHIKTLKKTSKKAGVQNLIRAMSFKRKSFKYENEVRIWAIAKESFYSKKEDKCIEMDLDWKEIDLRILVGPSKCDMDFKCYDKLVDYNQDKRKRENIIQQERKDKIVRELNIPKTRVKVTHLYDIPLWKSSKNLSK